MALFKRKHMVEPEPPRLLEFQPRRLRRTFASRRAPRVFTLAVDELSSEGIPERHFVTVKARNQQRALEKLGKSNAMISDSYRYRRGRKFGALE